MTQSAGMVKIGTIRFKGKCKRHPRFNPVDGPAALRGGCRRCQLLLEIHQAHGRLVDLIRQSKNDAEPERSKAAAAAADDRQGALF